jgi:hypothetical protein
VGGGVPVTGPEKVPLEELVRARYKIPDEQPLGLFRVCWLGARAWLAGKVPRWPRR